MNLLQLPKCLFGHHHRDHSRARLVDGNYHSVCTGCGRSMVRGFGGWKIDNKP